MAPVWRALKPNFRVAAARRSVSWPPWEHESVSCGVYSDQKQCVDEGLAAIIDRAGFEIRSRRLYPDREQRHAKWDGILEHVAKVMDRSQD